MTKIYSLSPYYDDFDPDDNYHRILFRPGKAVQARELTQSQTAIQNQIQKFGDYVLKEGTIVDGCSFTWDWRLDYLKIIDTSTNGNTVDVSTLKEGYILTGLSSNVTAYVVTATEGSQTNTSNTKTVFLKYTSGNVTTKTFSDAESIAVRTPAGALITTLTSFASGATGKGSSFTLGNGVIYVGGVFVENPKQTIILEKYSTTPSYKIGVTLSESIVTSDDDEKLLDPAVGSSNYFAPGADRYKAVTILTKKELNDSNVAGFYTLAEITAGVVKKSTEKTQLNRLLDQFASRTYEESGNYTVRPFRIRIREHLSSNANGGLFATPAGNINKLAIGIEDGIAYVQGYRVENRNTEYVTVDKGIDFSSEEQQPISFGYGNFVLVNQMAGPWDIDNGTSISLRSSSATAVTSETYGSTSAPGSQIGTARVKSVVYDSGTTGSANGIYRIHLYDVNLNANVAFANVRSIYYNAASGPDSIADIFLTSNVAVLQESNFNIGVFKFPQKAIKTLRDTIGNLDNSYQFKKKFSVTIATNGQFSVTSAIANEEFPFSVGVLNATQKRQSLVLSLAASAQTANLSGNVTFLTSSNVVYGNATTFTTTFSAGDRFIAGGNIYKIANVTSNTVLYVTNSLMTSAVTTGNYAKVFASGEYIDLTTNGSSGTARSANLVTDSQISIDIKETLDSATAAEIICDMQKTDGQEIQKILREDRFVKIDCSSAGTAGTYNLGFSDIFKITGIFHGTTYATTNTDVTKEFLVDNGQRETVYTHGRIIKKPGSTLTLTSASRLLIKLDFFSHDTSSGVGFLSVDSYPIDDTEATAGTIKTEQIPTFTSTSSGTTYDLRDCLDIRPRYADTATSATSIGSATVNPANPSSLTIPSGGLRVPAPNEEFNTDLDYYIGRFDLVYIDSTNLFGVKRGVPGLYPTLPEDVPQALSIANLYIPPFPSLPPQTAAASARSDYSTNAVLIDNRRYTMKDIGAINQKINRLEYYAALNFLEKQAKDLVISNATTGLDRFKNGFLVDNFTGHGIGDVNDVNYTVSIDTSKNVMRPKFYIDNIDVKTQFDQCLNVVRDPKDIVIKYTGNIGSFTSNSTITDGSATARIVHVVDDKLYLDSVIGVFSNTATITSSTATATVSNIRYFGFDGPQSRSSGLVTLPFEHEVFISNPFATQPRNVAGDLVFNWVGEMELDPPADNWSDISTNPDVVINFDNNADNWIALPDAWGTQWNDWQTDWKGEAYNTKVSNENVIGQTSTAVRQGSGTSITTTQTIQQTITGTVNVGQSKTGSKLSVTPETVNYNIGNRVVDVKVIPYMRSMATNFKAIRLKPNTRVYPFFDGEPVAVFCSPLGGNFGDPLVTDSNGTVTGRFLIPNNDRIKFRVGSKEFKLTDDNLNRPSFETTMASFIFAASGILQTQEGTILSSRQARLSVERLTDTKIIQEQTTFLNTAEKTTTSFEPDPPVYSSGGGYWYGDGGGGDGGSSSSSSSGSSSDDGGDDGCDSSGDSGSSGGDSGGGDGGDGDGH